MYIAIIVQNMELPEKDRERYQRLFFTAYAEAEKQARGHDCACEYMSLQVRPRS